MSDTPMTMERLQHLTYAASVSACMKPEFLKGLAETHPSALIRALAAELATLRERLAEAEEIIASKMDAITMTENALKRAEQRALAAEALAEQNAKDAERLDSIEKHGLRILTDLGVDAFREGRTFNTVRAFFDAAIAARKP